MSFLGIGEEGEEERVRRGGVDPNAVLIQYK